MKIPETFELGGRAWRVKWNNSTKHYGMTFGAQCVIKLSRKLNKTPEDAAHTFLHELLHAIAITGGLKKLNNDEATVDAVSNLLLQALETMK